MPEPVTLNVENGVARLALNRPPRNVMTAEVFGEISRLVGDVLPGLDVRGMVVKGSGRHFSSGADIEEIRGKLTALDGKEETDFLQGNVETLLALERLPYPVVAAVRGCCFGVGLELALACRWRVASPRAVFAMPEVSYGLIPGCGGTVRLREIAGTGRAVELILTGRLFGAGEALELGVVDLLDEDPAKAAENVIEKLGSGILPRVKA
jgi:enoyl-CoA hydratase/carnithine racemase